MRYLMALTITSLFAALFGLAACTEPMARPLAVEDDQVQAVGYVRSAAPSPTEQLDQLDLVSLAPEWDCDAAVIIDAELGQWTSMRVGNEIAQGADSWRWSLDSAPTPTSYRLLDSEEPEAWLCAVPGDYTLMLESIGHPIHGDRTALVRFTVP